MDVKQVIEARIAQLGQELAVFVDQANRQIAAQQGAIQGLEMILAELELAGDAGRDVLVGALTATGEGDKEE